MTAHFAPEMGTNSERVTSEENKSIDWQQATTDKATLKFTEPLTRSHGRIDSVVYQDGLRKFGYDRDGSINSITQPDGTIWTRPGGANSWDSGASSVSNVALDGNGNLSYNTWQSGQLLRTTIGTKSKETTPYSELLGDDLKEANRQYFSKVDINGDGKLSREEIKKAYKSSSYQDSTFRTYLNIIDTKYDDLRNLAGSQLNFTSKVSAADMDLCARREQEMLVEERNWQVARAVLDEGNVFAGSSPFDNKITARTLEKSRDDIERSSADNEAITFLERQIGQERVGKDDLYKKESNFVRSENYEFLTNMRTMRHDLSERNKQLTWLYVSEAAKAATFLGLTAAAYATGGMATVFLYPALMGSATLPILELTQKRQKIYESYWKPRLSVWDTQVESLEDARRKAHNNAD